MFVKREAYLVKRRSSLVRRKEHMAYGIWPTAFVLYAMSDSLSASVSCHQPYALVLYKIRFTIHASGVLSRWGVDRPQYMQRVSVAISNHLTNPNTPVDAAVWMQDAMFESHIGTLGFHRVAHGKHNSLTIVWVDECEQGALCAAGRSRRHAEQRVDLWRPEELTGLKVPVPEPHRRSGQGETAAPVTGWSASSMSFRSVMSVEIPPVA